MNQIDYSPALWAAIGAILIKLIDAIGQRSSREQDAEDKFRIDLVQENKVLRDELKQQRLEMETVRKNVADLIIRVTLLSDEKDRQGEMIIMLTKERDSLQVKVEELIKEVLVLRKEIEVGK